MCCPSAGGASPPGAPTRPAGTRQWGLVQRRPAVERPQPGAGVAETKSPASSSRPGADSDS